MESCLQNCTDDSGNFCDCKCNGGIVLNTNVPFIGRCIALGDNNIQDSGSSIVTQTTAFPILMKALTNILLSLILIASLIMLITGGIMIASS